jgi:Protein of unknown function (DUF3606)
MIPNRGTTVGEPAEININSEEELDWWAEYFNIHKDKVKEAVSIVGTSTDALHKYLQR